MWPQQILLWSIKPGTGVNTGVSLDAASETAPVVTLTGAGARTAVLVFTASQDSVDEGASETATITLGDLDAPAATNVAGGVAASDDDDDNTVDNTVTVTITDDDAAPTATLQLGSMSVAEDASSPVTVNTLSCDSVAAGQTSSTGTVTLTVVDDNVDNTAPRLVTVTAAVAGGGVTDPARCDVDRDR